MKELAKNNPAEEIYPEIGKINNELRFSIISKVGKTTATMERKFSQQNLIKNPCRNKVLPTTAGNLMSCKYLLKYGGAGGNETKCFQWVPPKYLIFFFLNN